MLATSSMFFWGKTGGVLEKEGLLEEHTFNTGVVSINYAEGPSSGRPLVLLHGGAGSWRSFLTVIPQFVPKWHVYAPDFRGHGRSGWVPGGYRWIDYVQDTVTFLRHRASEPVILWGFSFGGTIAVAVAAQASETVRALVLEDAWLDLQISKEIRQFLRYRRDLVASVGSLDEMIMALKNELVTLPGHDEPVRRGVVEDDVEIRLEAETLIQLDPEVYTFGWDGRLAEGYDMDAVLEQVFCPVLLLQAGPVFGGLVDDELAAHAMTLLSRGRLVSIPEARHSILQSQPRAAMRVVNEFLESLSKVA
jgi:pimeloyl-ACP methyl ester carboxylesterase